VDSHEVESDKLAPARGCLLALVISIPFWAFMITLIVIWRLGL